jgi:CheY-like chemotaxis protein
MDGIEAASKIQELNCGVPIVAMTANIMADDREMYKNYGMSDCVGKPFTSAELWGCLMKHFTPVEMPKINESKHDRHETTEFRYQLITAFVKDNHNKAAEINEAISAGDVKLAYRLVHTLRSNAGHLNKIILQNAAGDVEDELKKGLDFLTPENLRKLELELAAVLTDLTPMIEEHAAKKKPSEPPEFYDTNAIKQLLDKLSPLLEMGRSECQSLTEELRRVPGSEELIQQIEDYEFVKAFETLTRLKEHLKV